jgi:ectoine hydroxylase-related dioxygenase (phytanoyl-CoA dioxygenase family)
MLKSIITNKISAKKYQDEGFCYFGDFSIETFSKLKQLYVMNFNPDETIGLYPTHYNGIKEKNIFISNEIYSICRQELDNLFSDYKHLISHFVIKQKQFTSFFDLHQDWSIVEENEFEVVHLWIPLQDTHVNNGGLFIVPKSHKLFNNYRSGSLGIPFIQYSNKLEDYVNHLNLKSGQIFAYHPALFH